MRISSQAREAIAAYTGAITICEPGVARAPATPHGKTTGSATREHIRAFLGDDYAPFNVLNSERAAARGAQAQALAILRHS